MYLGPYRPTIVIQNTLRLSRGIPIVSNLDLVRRHYNETAFEYETRRLPEECPVEYALTLRWLDRWLTEGAVVADIGVGVGHYAQHLAERNCKVHLVDVAERLLTATQARLQSVGLQDAILGVANTSATDLNALPESNFDGVLLLGPLYHLCTLAERQLAVKQAARLLKPGGIIFGAGINRLYYLRTLWVDAPGLAKSRQVFHRRFLRDGVVDPDHEPRLGHAHLTTAAEFRDLFAADFSELMLAGVESFTGHHQKQWHGLGAEDREAWLEVIEATATMPEGYGPTEQLLYVGRKVSVSVGDP